MTVETVDVLYTAHATSEGGRNGTAFSGDGLVDVNLTHPGVDVRRRPRGDRAATEAS